MKLTYHENTPEEYEPPHFKPIAEEGLGHFARKPFSMCAAITVYMPCHVLVCAMQDVMHACSECMTG